MGLSYVDMYNIDVYELYDLYLKEGTSAVLKYIEEKYKLRITERTLARWFKKRNLEMRNRDRTKAKLYYMGLDTSNIKIVQKIVRGKNNMDYKIILKNGGSFLRVSAYNYGVKTGDKRLVNFYIKSNMSKFCPQTRYRANPSSFEKVISELKQGSCVIKKWKGGSYFYVVCPSGQYSYNGLVRRYKCGDIPEELKRYKYLISLGNKLEIIG